MSSSESLHPKVDLEGDDEIKMSESNSSAKGSYLHRLLDYIARDIMLAKAIIIISIESYTLHSISAIRFKDVNYFIWANYLSSSFN